MNVSRRGLLGMFAAGAGAAIIRTPGLLMPIKPQRKFLTLAEYARFLLSPLVPDLLVQSNDALNDLPWIGQDSTGSYFRVAIPTSKWRTVYAEDVRRAA